MKLISIIIATFNVEKVIEACLDNIALVKDDDIELIIIDGNSKDKSVSIIQTKYKELVDVFISEKDKGLYDAWNKGIDRSHGKWIMFLGADDRLIPENFIQYIKYVRTIDSSSVDLISAQAQYVDSRGELIKIVGSKFQWDEYKKNMLISHGSTMHNRTIFEKYGKYDISYRVCADYEMLMRGGEHFTAAFFALPVLKFVAGGASFSIACQKETFRIRRQYKTVPFVVNLFYSVKRIVGMYYKKFFYNI